MKARISPNSGALWSFCFNQCFKIKPFHQKWPYTRTETLLVTFDVGAISKRPPTATKLDDVSQVIILVDVNPYFWGGRSQVAAGSGGSVGLTFDQFLQHVLMFINSILLLNHLNQLVVIATGAHSCAFIYNSCNGTDETTQNGKSGSKPTSQYVSPSTKIIEQLEQFLSKEAASTTISKGPCNVSSLLSGSLSMALCYIQRSLRSDSPQPQPRILCLQGSPDAPQQYVAVMNAIFSAQRSMVPIDSCIVGNLHSAFLQQAAHITGGIYMKPPQLEGLLEYLVVVFATDLHSRRFLQLPRPAGVDFRASCFCHKKTIDMGFVCSVCLSIFCKHHRTCTTCGANFNQSKPTSISAGQKKVAGI